MAFNFKNADEINAFLLKNTTPLDYCKQIIMRTIAEIREYLSGAHPERTFSSLDFFSGRQCMICMKNHTVIYWTIETPLEAVVLPNPDDIEYVFFDLSIPMLMTKDQAKQYGLTDDDYVEISKDTPEGLCNLAFLFEEYLDYSFDSIHGVYHEDSEYGKTVRQNAYHQRSYIELHRDWTDYSAKLNITNKGYGGTYFAGTMDAAIGALVAEQLLMSNRPENRSLKYGDRQYKPLVVYAPIPQENWDEFYDEAFMKSAGSYCSSLISRLSLDAEGRCSGGFRRLKVTAFAEFIYLYAHSLLRTSHAANLTIIEPIFTSYLQKQREQRWLYQDDVLPEIQSICRTDYFAEPAFQKPETPYQHFQAAVWALTNSHSYMEAMKNILEFVDYQHTGKLAVILTGIFAGIYYQHYNIPKNLLTENRYYGRFSMSILPLTHPVYDGKRT